MCHDSESVCRLRRLRQLFQDPVSKMGLEPLRLQSKPDLFHDKIFTFVMCSQKAIRRYGIARQPAGRVDVHERSTVVSTEKRQGKSLVAESMYYSLQSAARLAVTASR